MMNDQNINDQEKSSIATLGKALQDARLSASLTVEEVAEQLNLAISTVREIEGDLAHLIENKKYPHIYLRGYLANYAKLVALEKLNQFPEYQQLSGSQTHPKNLRPSIKVSPAKKLGKWLLLSFILIAVVCLGFFIVQQAFSSESEAELPKSEKIKADNENSVTDVEVINATASEKEVPNVVEGSENTTSQKEDTFVEQNIAVKTPAVTADVAIKENVNPAMTKPAPQTIILKASASEPKKEVIIKNQVNAQQLLFEPEVTAVNALTIESLQLTFSADCWTEIVDVKGKRLAFDLYKQGASITVKGEAPFRLKLGDPSVVTIHYQNKMFEHKFAAGRTVRFTVPQPLS